MKSGEGKWSKWGIIVFIIVIILTLILSIKASCGHYPWWN